MAYGTDRVEHPSAPHDHAVPAGPDHERLGQVTPSDADLAPVGGLKH
jgi:hypothetical protein